MWMPAHTTEPPLAVARERRRHELPRRGEHDRGVELLRRGPEGVSGPLRAERARELLRHGVLGTREGEDTPALVARHLADDVRRGAEPVEAEPLGVAGETERAIADQPGAEERRRLGRDVRLG